MFLSCSLETKHAAATKSLLFYPVAWPMDTYNMYMQLHFYMPTHTYVSFPIIICTHAGCNVGCGNLLNYLGLCVCVYVCMCVCVCVCERERERECVCVCVLVVMLDTDGGCAYVYVYICIRTKYCIAP